MILITGCFGFIGFWLAKTLLDLGYRVIGVDAVQLRENTTVYEKYQVLGRYAQFSLVNQDLSTVDYTRILPEVEYVFHFAAQSKVRNATNELANLLDDIACTQRLLDACVGTGIRKVVFASSASVYGNKHGMMSENDLTEPVSFYGIAKLSIEKLFHLYRIRFDVPGHVFRFFTVYGEYQPLTMGIATFISNMIEGKPLPLYGSGGQLRDFTNIHDIIAANILLLKHERCDTLPSPCNIATGKPVSLLEVVSMLEEITGRKAIIQQVASNKYDIDSTWADITLAQSVLQYAPAVPLREGLEKQYLRFMETAHLG